MKFFKLISSLLEAELNKATAAIKDYELKSSENMWYLESGKMIEDIANLYPASAKDAAIIFEEWCKGLLTDCRPDSDVLREYAKHTADPAKYRAWVRDRLHRMED